ncbi:MAG: hypothetical protein ABI893_15235 [Polaromonas sp.]|uniref:hypothetical protein n=1 Tax=Polaromonas sp. TaxID=1869339 RepID=UPI003264CC29
MFPAAKIPIALLAFLALSGAARAAPDLVGEWKSDAVRSTAFNDAHARLQPETARFLSQLMGHMTLKITASTFTFDIPDVQTETAEGKKSLLQGFRESQSYQLLGTTDKTVAIKRVAPKSSSPRITVYNFESPDIMWMYVDNADDAGMTHVREYFFRIPASAPPKDAAR